MEHKGKGIMGSSTNSIGRHGDVKWWKTGVVESTQEYHSKHHMYPRIDDDTITRLRQRYTHESREQAGPTFKKKWDMQCNKNLVTAKLGDKVAGSIAEIVNKYDEQSSPLSGFLPTDELIAKRPVENMHLDYLVHLIES